MLLRAKPSCTLVSNATKPNPELESQPEAVVEAQAEAQVNLMVMPHYKDLLLGTRYSTVGSAAAIITLPNGHGPRNLNFQIGEPKTQS